MAWKPTERISLRAFVPSFAPFETSSVRYAWAAFPSHVASVLSLIPLGFPMAYSIPYLHPLSPCDGRIGRLMAGLAELREGVTVPPADGRIGRFMARLRAST